MSIIGGKNFLSDKFSFRIKLYSSLYCLRCQLSALFIVNRVNCTFGSQQNTCLHVFDMLQIPLRNFPFIKGGDFNILLGSIGWEKPFSLNDVINCLCYLCIFKKIQMMQKFSVSIWFSWAHFISLRRSVFLM